MWRLNCILKVKKLRLSIKVLERQLSTRVTIRATLSVYGLPPSSRASVAGLYGKISGGLTYWDVENVYSVDLRKNRKLKWLDSITGLSLIMPELGVVQ